MLHMFTEVANISWFCKHTCCVRCSSLFNHNFTLPEWRLAFTTASGKPLTGPNSKNQNNIGLLALIRIW